MELVEVEPSPKEAFLLEETALMDQSAWNHFSRHVHSAMKSPKQIMMLAELTGLSQDQLATYAKSFHALPIAYTSLVCALESLTAALELLPPAKVLEWTESMLKLTEERRAPMPS